MRRLLVGVKPSSCYRGIAKFSTNVVGSMSSTRRVASWGSAALLSGGVAYVALSQQHTSADENKNNNQDDQPKESGNWVLDKANAAVDSVVGSVKGAFWWFFAWVPQNHKKPVIPPPLPPQYRRPYVLVVDLETLVSVRYEPGKGWRTKKRPGVDYFLSLASQVAEVIVFSSKLNGGVGWTLVPRLDPSGAISYKFFQDFDKDVASLNRPMEKMIIITDKPEEYMGNNPAANMIVLETWDKFGDDKDTTLLELSAFLQEMGRFSGQVADVRTILGNFKQQNKTVMEVYRDKARQKVEQKEEVLQGKKKGFFT